MVWKHLWEVSVLILLIWLSSKERSAPAGIIPVQESKTKHSNHSSCTSKDQVLSCTKFITSENFCLKMEGGASGLLGVILVVVVYPLLT